MIHYPLLITFVIIIVMIGISVYIHRYKYKHQKIIATELKGGFGNILFIISFICTLSHHTGLKFTIPNLDSYVLPHGTPPIHNKLDYIRQRLYQCPLYLSKICIDKFEKITETSNYSNQWDEYVYACQTRSANILFDGHFLNIEYVRRAPSYVYSLFAEPSTISDVLDKSELHMNEAIFIHVRHGDYIEWNATVSPDYYVRALTLSNFDWTVIKYIYVFTYNVSNISEHVMTWTTIVPKTTQIIVLDSSILPHDLDQFYAMVRMRYGGICANSTFTWWPPGSILHKINSLPCLIHGGKVQENSNNLIFGIPIDR